METSGPTTTSRSELPTAFRDVADASPAVLWMTDLFNKCVFLSRGWEDLTGQAVSDGLGFGWLTVVHPDDRDRARDMFLDAASRQVPFTLAMRVLSPGGLYRWVHDIGRPLHSEAGEFIGYTGAVFDSDEQQRLHNRLQFLDQLSEATRDLWRPEDVMVTAAELLGKHLKVNRCAYAEVEENEEQFRIVRDYCMGCTSSAGEYELSAFGSRATADMRSGRTLIISDRDQELASAEGGRTFGAIGIAAIICCPLLKQGKLRAMMAVHSIEPRRWTEEEVALVQASVDRCWAYIERARAETALREREKALEEAHRRKNEFLAMLAHELRNPMAAVKSALILHESSDDAEERVWARQVVDRQTTQLARLIDDLLDVSRITSGKIRLHLRHIDAAVVIEHALQTARPLFAAKKHKLRYERSETALPVFADETRLEQMILNLLTNAAKYTESDGTITVSTDETDREIIIQVRDTGVGIAPESLNEVFELFAQGERSLSRSEGGLGLGLTIVRELCRLHSGSITGFSEGAGKGSEFTIRLPRATPTSEGTDTTPTTLSSPSPSRKILVVDDNRDSSGALVRILRRRGHTAEEAHDGSEALLKAKVIVPDVILLDLGLPILDGYEVALRLRQDPSLKDKHVIAISGYGQFEDVQRALRSGCDAHLVKPVDIDHLINLINTAR